MAKKPPMLSPSQFIGMKDDIDPKLIPATAFVAANNFNFPDDGLLGMDKILMPEIALSLVSFTTALRNAMDASQTTIDINDQPPFAPNGDPYYGMVTIDSEQILFTQITFTMPYGPWHLAGCTRGVNGTTATAHNVGSIVQAGACANYGSSILFYCSGLKNIDGIKEYNFIDTTGVAHDYFCVVSEGVLFFFNKDWTPANLFVNNEHNYAHSSFNFIPLNIKPGKVSIQIYGSNLYIANGIDYPVVFYGSLYQNLPYNDMYLVSQMGSPIAIAHIFGSQAYGTYKYALSYVTAGGEEIIGTNSIFYSTNISGASGCVLSIPIGYADTVSRKLYRTKQGSFTTFYLVATIGDNTTLTYSDTTVDASLGAAMSTTVNNPCPIPYFLNTANGCLYGAKNDLHPTQAYKTDTGIQVFDSANYIEIADQADDNTPVEGIGNDFGSILVATAKNWYLLSPNASDATVTDVTPTRAFCGCKSGYTIKELASFGDFAGGLMFVSSYNDVRIITGMDALPISISVNNMRTQNYGQNIVGSLTLDLLSYTNIYAEYFNYKYHLVIDGNKYVFDIRTQGWTKHSIVSAGYTSSPLILSVLNLGTPDVPNYQLFNGQSNGTIEQEYSLIQYQGQDVPATLVSGYLLSAAEYKNVQSIRFWLKSYDSYGGSAVITVITDDNTSSAQTITVTVPSAPFDQAAFDPRYFECIVPLDYQVININTNYRWLQYSMVCTVGSISLQKVELLGDMLENQEG